MASEARKIKRNSMRIKLGNKGMGLTFNLEQQRKRLSEINIDRSLRGLSPITPERFIRKRGVK